MGEKVKKGQIWFDITVKEVFQGQKEREKPFWDGKLIL